MQSQLSYCLSPPSFGPHIKPSLSSQRRPLTPCLIYSSSHPSPPLSPFHPLPTSFLPPFLLSTSVHAFSALTSLTMPHFIPSLHSSPLNSPIFPPIIPFTQSFLTSFLAYTPHTTLARSSPQSSSFPLHLPFPVLPLPSFLYPFFEPLIPLSLPFLP